MAVSQRQFLNRIHKNNEREAGPMQHGEELDMLMLLGVGKHVVG